jgi:hypothetical protein
MEIKVEKPVKINYHFFYKITRSKYGYGEGVLIPEYSEKHFGF